GRARRWTRSWATACGPARISKKAWRPFSRSARRTIGSPGTSPGRRLLAQRPSPQRRRHLLDGEFPLSPEIQPAQEGANTLEAVALQQQRHPGARGLVRSRAVQDDLAVGRDLVATTVDLLGLDPLG